jgi:hypothetical protein
MFLRLHDKIIFLDLIISCMNTVLNVPFSYLYAGLQVASFFIMTDLPHDVIDFSWNPTKDHLEIDWYSTVNNDHSDVLIALLFFLIPTCMYLWTVTRNNIQVYRSYAGRNKADISNRTAEFSLSLSVVVIFLPSFVRVLG